MVPAVVLMIGIGMLITAVTNDAVKGSMAPLITRIIPTTAAPYIIIFTLVAPLTCTGAVKLVGHGERTGNAR